MIEILETAPLNTVQDTGRFGFRHFGVGTAGAMDDLALSLGNALLGNPLDAAGIEVQMHPFHLRVTVDTAIAVTGAAEAKLDGLLLPPDWAVPVRAGQVLSLDTPPKRGARSYVAIAGGIDVPVLLGSRSTCLRNGYGGHKGRPLSAGDRLPMGAATATPVPPGGIGAAPMESGEPLTLRVIPAAQHDAFPEQVRARFWDEGWKVTMQSNRMGLRLEGTALRPEKPFDIRSSGIVPGVIQVPPAGQPIIQLRDANSAGGYPKMGVVIEADLWRLGQARPGDTLRFRRCAQAEAVDALRAIDAYLADVAATAALCRGMASR
jgi:biotin-dependent carboxylase-like uncharacterized protein